MKLEFVFVSAFLILCEGKAPWTTKRTTTTATAYNTTTTTRSTTTTMHYPINTGGPGVNLKGKMFTLTRNARVTFFPPNYFQDPSTTTTAPKPRTKSTRAPSTTTTPTTKSTTTTTRPTTTTTTTTTKSTTTRITTTTTSTAMTRTTTWPTTTTTPVTRGLSVCLRYLADRGSIDFFTLAPNSNNAIIFSMVSQWYTLSNRVYQWSGRSDRGVQVSLNPTIPLWAWVQTQPWTGLCVVLDSFKRVVQVFQGGSMSIRKILPSQMVWSGEPVLDVPGFEGQVTDLEVWDYPLKYEEVFSYMKNYGSSGTVLTWSSIAYRSRGDVLVEETYALQMRQTISSEGEERPIRKRGGRGHGRDRQSRYKSMFSGWRQKKILI